VNGFYGGEKRQRGGRKRRKNKHREEQAVAQDWDDIYDPTRPNSYEEYKHSEEKIREIREWKDRLYAHRMAQKSESEKDSDEEDYRPQMRSKKPEFSFSTKMLMDIDQFAPPSNYSFAPPPMDSPPPKPADSKPDSYSLAPTATQPPPPPPPETLSAGAISRAPVRYNLPPAPTELPTSEAELEKALAAEPEEDQPEDAEEAPRSLRPGQKGFAERLMSKYGWSKGSGLGADGSGIVNPLQVKIEKRKKKSDAEGGGLRDPPGGRGKIIGGRKNVPESEAAGKFGPMSEVIVLRGMVDGMDLDEEVEGSGDGGLMQEIGDECGEKVGFLRRVRRIELTVNNSMDELNGSILISMEKYLRYSSNLRASCLLYE
jgi:splicing factor 45